LAAWIAVASRWRIGFQLSPVLPSVIPPRGRMGEATRRDLALDSSNWIGEHMHLALVNQRPDFTTELKVSCVAFHVEVGVEPRR
jgi:hypothetical protein